MIGYRSYQYSAGMILIDYNCNKDKNTFHIERKVAKRPNIVKKGNNAKYVPKRPPHREKAAKRPPI